MNNIETNNLPFIDKNKDIAIDLETCDPLINTVPGYISGVGFIAGISLYNEDGNWYIPINHGSGFNYNEKETLEWLSDILSGNSTKIFFNAQYDVGWLHYYGVKINGEIVDKMLAAPLLNSNRQNGYGLNAVSLDYLGEGKDETLLEEEAIKEFTTFETIEEGDVYVVKYKTKTGKWAKTNKKFKDIEDLNKFTSNMSDMDFSYTKEKEYKTVKKEPSKKEIKGLMWKLPAEKVAPYAMKDSELTYRLYKTLMPLLKKENLINIFKLENELLPVLLDMRIKGIRVDIPKLKELDVIYTEEIEKYQKQLNEIAGYEVNAYAPTELVELCKKFNIEITETEAGNPSFSAKTKPKDEFGIFNIIEQLKLYTKARDVFIRAYLTSDYLIGDRIHPQINQLKGEFGGTVTGRVSCSSPNLQNIPSRHPTIGKDLRSCFIPDEGHKIVTFDYSEQEPRMLIDLTIRSDKNKNVIKGADLARSDVFRSRNSKFHNTVTDITFKDEIEKIKDLTNFKSIYKDEYRTPAKTIGLGIMYGRGVGSIFLQLLEMGLQTTLEKTKNIKETVLKAVPFLEPVSLLMQNQAKVFGYITTILGRKIRFDNWSVTLFTKEEYEMNNNVALLYDIIESVGIKEYKKDFFRKQSPKGYMCSITFFNRKDANAFYNKLQSSNIFAFQPQRDTIYKALNAYIQGSSGDQTKKAMIDIYKLNYTEDIKSTWDIFFERRNIIKNKLNIPSLQIHDELMFSLPEQTDIQEINKIAVTMEKCIDLFVECKCEPGIGKNWYEAKKES